MVRQIKYDHNAIVTLPQDNTKEVSKDEWNDGHNESGMTGHNATTLTIATASITPVTDMHIIDGEGAADDTLDTIDNTETNDKDELQLLGGAQTITVSNNVGNIFTLSGEAVILSTTIANKFIRIGTNWYETGSNVSASSDSTVFGDGSDGDETISSDTDLGSSNFKQYNNLTIDATFTLTGDSPLIIKVKGTLTLNGDIICTGKGAAGGGAGASGTGDGGAGGGLLVVSASTTVGTGKLQANGEAGGDASASTVAGTGDSGTAGLNDDGDETAPTAGSGAPGGTALGGAGGAMVGDGGQGDSSSGTGGTGQVVAKTLWLQNTLGSGGGGGSDSGVTNVGGGGGGGSGVVLFFTENDTSSFFIEAHGGAGGTGVGAFDGGGGGGGRILVIFYFGATDNTTTTVTGGIGANNGDDGAASVLIL